MCGQVLNYSGVEGRLHKVDIPQVGGEQGGVRMDLAGENVVIHNLERETWKI